MTVCPVDKRSILRDQPWIGWAGVNLEHQSLARDGYAELPYNHQTQSSGHKIVWNDFEQPKVGPKGGNQGGFPYKIVWNDIEQPLVGPQGGNQGGFA